MHHIILISTSYPVIQDGREAAGSFVVDFAETLAQRVKVTVVAPGLEASYNQLNDNLAIRRFYAPYQPLSLLKAYNPRHWPYIVSTLRNGQAAVQIEIKGQNIIHIIALWALPSGYWARKAANPHGIPYSTWALGSDIWSLGKLPIIKNILQQVLKDSSFNFADGLRLKEDVEKLSKRPCIFLPSTRKLNIEKKKVLAEKPPYKLAFLGRWHKNKGIDLLFDCLKILKDADWQYIKGVKICGGGPLENKVHNYAAILKDEGRPVIVKGYQNKEEATNLLLWADYLLIPSRIESIPVVFSDALQTMTPAIVMPVGDFPALYKKCAVGEIANSTAPGDFATAIRSALYSSPKNYESQLLEKTSNFNIETSVQDFMTTILEFTQTKNAWTK